jgi:hypothetical protein
VISAAGPLASDGFPPPPAEPTLLLLDELVELTLIPYSRSASRAR